MTPAEHYAAAEKILAEVGEAAEGLGKDPVALAESGAWEVAGLMVQLGMAEAQVHATLATVPAFPTKWIESSSGIECTCPHLPSQPKALVGTDPACPIHGETP